MLYPFFPLDGMNEKGIAVGVLQLQAVSFDKTEPDDEERIYSTQWSSVYDLTNPTLYMCADQKYDTVYTYSVAE